MKYVGVDLGGTHIACGIVDEVEGILYKNSMPTCADKPYDVVLGRIITAIESAIVDSKVNKDSIGAIGIGIPGIETPQGDAHAKNLYWDGVPLRRDISEALSLPTYIDNDAHAAALAELGFGCLQGTSQSVMLTLGTGVGGAIIVNGKVVAGYNHAGGELGHITFVHGGVPCSCGRAGCLERYTSATAMIRIGKEYAVQYPDSILHTVEGGLENINARSVVDGARVKDIAASYAFADYCEYLADGIVSFINMLNPQRVCLGGGVANAGDFLFDILRTKCKDKYFSPLHVDTEIVPATLGNDAGILGAAVVAIQESK